MVKRIKEGDVQEEEEGELANLGVIDGAIEPRVACWPSLVDQVGEGVESLHSGQRRRQSSSSFVPPIR